MKLIKSTFGKFLPIIAPHRVACGGGYATGTSQNKIVTFP
jgi:hypothetical protein